ncbi:MAG: tetratricopeptide repeat protein [Methanothrix sp.]|nr:MAG: tetratricopeptide repeat protein [Methanothrix sp.]
MNSWRVASLILGIMLVTTFVSASEQILRIKADDQENVICKQKRDLSREHLASTIENAKALYNYCGCYDEKLYLEEARECYGKVKYHCDTVFNVDPSNPTALDLKTSAEDRIYELDGDMYELPPGSNCTCVKNSSYDSIIAGYDNITRLDPSNAKAWNNRGALLAELCCIEETKASFDEAISINSSLAEPWYNKGVCLFWDNPQEALQCFNRTVELDPGLAEAWFNRYPLMIPTNINMSSPSYLVTYKEAVASYNKALELDPDLGLYKPPYLIYRRMN